MDILKGAALAVALMACDPVVDGRYRGEPLFSFEGELVQYEGLAAQEHEFRTTLLWLRELGTDPRTQLPRLDDAIEQNSVSVELRFPSTFRVDLFAPPAGEMLQPNGLGVALVVVYEDRDGNGRLTADASPSELVGGAPYEALVYARDEAAARAAPFDVPIAQGFQLVRVPLFCGAELSPCTTPLGAPCVADGDCGAEGVCLSELDGVTWPGGACALRYDTVTCEVPDDAGFYDDALGELYAIEGCASEDECRDGYVCDELAGGCLPGPGTGRAPFSAFRSGGCEVPLGAPCVLDSDCGDGLCLVRSNGESFVGGYCALPIDVATCTPEDGREIAWDFTESDTPTHWFRACEVDTDCRTAEGYLCDPWFEVCLPTSPVALELGPDYRPPTICYGAL